MNKHQWNFSQNTKFFIHENASENIICETAAILSRGRWVNDIDISKDTQMDSEYKLLRQILYKQHKNIRE